VGSASHLFFPPFRLDAPNAQLWRGDQQITLRRKTFDVLLYLVNHPAQLVTKAALLDTVWAGVTVSDSMPAICVKELRKALDDEAKTPRFIETVYGRGYRFVAKVTSDSPGEMKREPLAGRKSPKPIVVGREVELARLHSWHSDVFEGERRVIFVAGEAGIGKTTFVQAFLGSVAQEGTARIGRGQCVEQYGAGEPYMPVLEALSRLGQEAGGERVIELLNRFAPTWLTQMPELLTREERVRLQSEMQGVTQQRMLREMTRALEALAAETPLVLLLEDLHWSDFSTLELISAIARRSELARLLIIGTYRPVEILANDHPLRTMKQELELHHYCEELRLKLLSEQDIVDYLAKRLASDGSRQFGTLAPLIHTRTDGNPLFMVNMVDYLLVDAGLLVNSREVSEAQLAEALHAHRLDALRNIRQMIERNLEQLKPEEQAVLESASVAGAEFSAASVAAALERPQDEVEACCTHLSRHEQFVSERGPITWPDGTVATGFRFHHALYQEVLYGRLSAGHQVQYHRRIAMREEAGYGERVGEVATELAHHYKRANDKDKAIEYFRLAGERAVARGAMVEAEHQYVRARDLLAELPNDIERDRRELSLQIALGTVLWSSKSWAHPEVARASTRAQELAERLGENGQLVMVLYGLAAAISFSGQYKASKAAAERMLVAAEQSEDRASLCAAHYQVGIARVYLAEFDEARKHLEMARGYYDETDPSRLNVCGVDAPALEAMAALQLGFPARAKQLINESLRRMAHCQDAFHVGAVHLWAGGVYIPLRDPQGTLEHSEALRLLALQQPAWTGVADYYTGEALLMQGKQEEGVARVRSSIAFFTAVGLDGMVPWPKLAEVKFVASQGQVDDALAMIDGILQDTEELAYLKSPTLRQRASLLAQSGADASTIEAAYRAAIECARSQGARYYELQATTPFARWLKSQGRAAEAQSLLAGIYAWFTEGFDTADLKDAKALLDELSG
jgi:predicted ATPase